VVLQETSECRSFGALTKSTASLTPTLICMMQDQHQETGGQNNRASTEQETNAITDEIRRLENAVGHLVRSNTELKEAIARQEDEDGEFRSAIGENIVLIAKYRAKIARLKEEISKSLRSECEHARAPIESLLIDNGEEAVSIDVNAVNARGYLPPSQGLDEGMYL
jgi:septal ring factor EnvC (AmiA/AmiB activator)